LTRTDPTVVVQTTAACHTLRHSLCRGVIYTLTTGLGSPLSDCACPCHEPAPIEDDELEDLLDREADRRLDDERAWA
jgi:hypothetical protein